MDISLKIAIFIFGLNEKYSQSQINSAYRKFANFTHPDTCGDINLFLFINECKEILENNLQTSSNSFESFCNNKAINHFFLY